MKNKTKNLAIASINKSHLYKLGLSLNKFHQLNKFYSGFPIFNKINSFSNKTILREHHIGQTLFKFRKFIFLENKNRISDYLAFKSSNNFDNWLSRKIDKDNIEILISEGFYSSKSGLKIRNKGGKYIVERPCAHIMWQKKVIEEAGNKFGYIPRMPSKGVIKAELKSYEIANKIVVASQFVKRTFEEFGLKEKVIVIPYGAGLISGNNIDKDLLRTLKLRNNSKKELKILFVGNASLRKGINILFEACSKLKIPYSLNLVGSIDPFGKKIIEIYNNLNLNILGNLKKEKLSEIYLNSDILILPSIEDGYGMVVPEAMSYGTVPIVSLNAGAADLVENYINGFLFDKNSSNELLKKIMIYWEMDLIERMKLIEKCICKDNKKNWDNYGLKFIELINKIN